MLSQSLHLCFGYLAIFGIGNFILLLLYYPALFDYKNFLSQFVFIPTLTTKPLSLVLFLCFSSSLALLYFTSVQMLADVYFHCRQALFQGVQTMTGMVVTLAFNCSNVDCFISYPTLCLSLHLLSLHYNYSFPPSPPPPIGFKGLSAAKKTVGDRKEAIMVTYC